MNALWRKWTIHCALGELLGIGCAGGIAFFVSSITQDTLDLKIKILVLLAMMFAGFLEGAILGFFQWKVLVKKFETIPRREWMYYTILVGILGWFLGMLPSLFFMPSDTIEIEKSSAMSFDDSIIFLALSCGTGLVLGSIFGLFQWLSLRKYSEKAYKWIIANALGWGLGLGWIYIFASIPAENSSLQLVIFVGICGGILAGISVGAVTGFILIKLKKKIL